MAGVNLTTVPYKGAVPAITDLVGGDFHLLMPLYICRRWDGDVVAREGQNLKWVRANKLRDYPMPPADIPLIPHLIDLLM